jgi:hypothetical protein
MSNREESTAGTHPTDATSRLLLQARLEDGRVSLHFLAAPRQTYSVEMKDDLNGPSWHKLVDILADLDARELQVIDPTPRQQRLYRLVTPRQP